MCDRCFLDVSLDYYFAKSKFGNTVLVVGENRFKLSNKNGKKSRWRCIKNKCLAYVFTVGEAIDVINDEHSHWYTIIITITFMYTIILITII